MENLTNKYVEVRAEQEDNTLFVQFLGFVPYDEFLKIVEHEYKLIRHYQLRKCLIDLRQIPVYDAGMPEYVKDVWFPTVSSLGVKSVAFVVPEKVLGQMTMKKAHKGTETISGMSVEHFDDLELARIWLRAQ